LHAQHLEQRFGAGPHTISVPRLEPAEGSLIANNPPSPLSVALFTKVVAILRLAVPYTGIILSTREPAELRGELLDLGISQMSAGSCTSPGGYSCAAQDDAAQFAVSDHRSLEEVINDITQRGYLPSFCTGCYRQGRTGPDFMALAKPGLIHTHCQANALLTYQEYLLDFASEKSRQLGEEVIRQQLALHVSPERRPGLERALQRLAAGERDLYV
jgi:2-iminoacetate synthase